MEWKGRKVLVTGAGGFIGSHLCEQLLERGAEVRGMVHGNMRGSVGYLAGVPAPLAKHLEICGGNIRDGAFVREATQGVDTVFHHAAITSVAYSYANPEETIITNVMGTLNVCNAARHEHVRRVVHTSSAGVYGTSKDGRPITETHPVAAHNPYTASKLAADHTAESFYLTYELPVATCRIFNVYGPRIGQFLVIPTIILQLARGAELRLGDLAPTRNFTYVDDIVNAFIRTAEADSVIGEVVNFGSTRAVTIGDLAQLIANLMNKDLQIVTDASRIRPQKSEIQRVEADSSKAKALLGWEASVSLEDGLQRTIDWILAGGYDDMPVRR
ncbi:MAG: NAD-dependent epimerase/dehydratase family protein [Candidatus Hydrogenedentes bacterium]|nr:NAD-dependent epimerase/dehydratase family protein [Candidatus Hydrogenedentota bacterium]